MTIRVSTHILRKILFLSSHFLISTRRLQEFLRKTVIIQKQNSTEAPWTIAEIQSLTHEGEVEVGISEPFSPSLGTKCPPTLSILLTSQCSFEGESWG